MSDLLVAQLPWTKVAIPHEDILKGELAIDTFAVDLARVAQGDQRTPRIYREPRAFFEATYLTSALRGLLRDVQHVLAGRAGDRVLQLRTPFGGGKSHSLVALYHLATGRDQVANLAEIASLPNPGPTKVAVLAGIDLDASRGRLVTPNGPNLRTLWGELAWQLGSQKYELVRAQDEARTAPGGQVLRQVLEGAPTLILLDEVLVYVEKALTIPVLDSSYGRQVLVFLQTLTEVVRSLPQAAMVYSLQASAAEALGDEGLLSDLDKLVSRIDAKREPVSGDEVLRLVQRRLFQQLGDLSQRQAVARAYAELRRKFLESLAGGESERRDAAAEAEKFEQRVLDSYPFHPDLLDLMYERWGSLPSYQRTRGALQFLARAVHAQWHGTRYQQPQALIGPGDVSTEDEGVRGAFFSQVGEREAYTAVLASDLTGANARAREVDAHIASESPALSQLKVGTRLATAALLYSFGARSGEDQGIGETDLIAACLAPGLDRMVLATALAELREQLLYLHYTGRRYRFETQPNLNKLVSDEARKFSGEEVLARIKSDLTTRLGAPNGTPVWPPDNLSIPDHDPVFRIVYLGLEWAERSPESLEYELRQLVERRGTGMRDYRNALAFAVPGRQAADKARTTARQLLGVEELLKNQKRYGFKPEQLEELKERERNASADLDGTLRKLYEIVYLPAQATTASADTAGVMMTSEGSPIALLLVDLRAELATSPQVHARIMGALRTHVFTTVTPEKIVTLTRLGQPTADSSNGQEGPQALPCEQVVTYFFMYLGYPRLQDTSALKIGIARGIEQGRFGYVAGVASMDQQGLPVVSEGRFVRYGQSVQVNELSLEAGAYLLAPALAVRMQQIGALKPPTLPPTSQEPVPGKGEGAGAGTAGWGTSIPTNGGVKDGSGTYTPIPQPQPVLGSKGFTAISTFSPGARPRRYRLHITANARQMFSAWEALQRLSDESAEMTITLDVVAQARDGFDLVWLRNAVAEPLDEANITFEESAEE